MEYYNNSNRYRKYKNCKKLSYKITPNNYCKLNCSYRHSNRNIPVDKLIVKNNDSVVVNAKIHSSKNSCIKSGLPGPPGPPGKDGIFANYDQDGLVTQIATGHIVGRSIIGTTSQITVVNGEGVNGDPTISLPLSGTGIVHTIYGQLSTSLIIDSDISPTANITDSKLATIHTIGKVSNSATTAKSSDTSNTIVLRNELGDFYAGMINASLTGQVMGAASLNVLKSGDTMTGELYVDGGIDVNETANIDSLNIGTTYADVINLGTASSVQVINMGTGSGITTINIGGQGDSINLGCTVIKVNTTIRDVKDKLITLNVDTLPSSGFDSGLQIEENSIMTGYVKTAGTNQSWVMKAPGNTGVVTIKPGASGYIIDQGSHDPVTLDTTNGLSLNIQKLSLAAASTSTTGALTSTDWFNFNSKQPGSTTLAALAAYDTTGFLTQIATDTFVGRSIDGTIDQISVANGSGLLGNPTISLPSTIKVDVIDERTGNVGVTIDSVLLKDGLAFQGDITAPTTNEQLANKKYVDDAIIAPGYVVGPNS